MELWIRSQDKEKLCKIHDLCVRENQNENNETNYVIQDVYTMGTYSTKERALEVLDEIQGRRKMLNLIPYLENLSVPLWNRVNEFLHNEKDIFTYEMPKE